MNDDEYRRQQDEYWRQKWQRDNEERQKALRDHQQKQAEREADSTKRWREYYSGKG